jgi:transaldolase
MKIFIDTADIAQIRKYAKFGFIDGVTTNPALLAKEGRHFLDVVNEILDIIDGPISGEVVSLDAENMIREARSLSKIHHNIVVKLPAIPPGFEALRVLSEEGIKTNFTVVYNANQALLAAKNGATYVSPFVGRLDANAGHGSSLISEIVKIFNNYEFDTKILAASMRNSVYVKEAALAGAHIATIPPEVLDDMMTSELSEVALKGFLDQWDKLSNENKDIFGEENEAKK